MKTLGNTQSRYTPDPGTHPDDEVILCGVCGAETTCRRNVNGPRGFAMAMSGSKSPHDVYSCPLRDEDWHQQVVALRREASGTSSKKLETMLLEEAEEVLSNRLATKPTSELRGL